MHDLTAQVTSSLLPFPGVTLDALGEDEINLDSVLHGNFTVGRCGVAWLACGPHLEIVHAVTGERLSAYCFSGGGDQPPTILAARDFSWLKRSGLLVGLEEAEGNVLCLYDLGLSRVVKAVVIPGRITAIEPLVSYGGASTSTQHLHQGLRWFFGIAAVVTDIGHVLLVDLCLDDLSGNQNELEASALQVVTKSPGEIPKLREVSTRQGRHLCLQLNGPSGVGATVVQYIPRTNQLAVGFSNGYLQLWNMKTLKKEYHSQLEGGGVAVYAFTFQEPENDPRNCCYLWAVQSSQDLEGDTVSLRLLQLAFSERKCLSSGKILYEGLEYCEERYSHELSGTAFPHRAQTTNTRLLGCQTIEKFRPHPDRDDSMNEVASPDTSVSIFSWQVKAYGQGMPLTYIGVFDINRWYHAQMPDSLRTGESLQNCPYLAVWSLDPVVQMVSPHALLDVVVHERSLSRGLPYTCPPPEQYFNPTTYNFDATCLLNSGIVHLTCSGYQKETLSFLKKAAPCSSEIISTSYSRCLMSGLLSSRLADTQASSLSQEEQLDAILCTAVETSSLGLITGCIKQWTAEEQPGSTLNLRYILDWAWNKVVQTKEELDGICAPLFDSSSNFTDPQTLQLLQHSQRLLGNLSTIFHCLLSEAQEVTEKGLLGLINKNLVSSLISKYAQVVLWFCRTGLLPEGSDDDALQISRPFYTHSVISNYYTIRREELTRLAKGKWSTDCLMIDGLVGQCGERFTDLWKRDEGGTGQYPPPTLHALLDIYLLDSIDETAKHAIVIYLLLDVMHSFPNKEGASVHSFPSAFDIPIGLVKLVQGLWLLDHHGHQSSFELLLHPAAAQCHFEWQHERVLQALMCQGQHSIALRYFHVTKPPVTSTSQAKLCLSVLLHNRCLVDAWALLRQHSNRPNMGELLGFLYESCQELGLVKELLKLPLGPTEQECLEKFLQGTGGLQNRELLMVHYLQQANYIPALQLNHSLKLNLVNERDPKLKERSITRNSILEQYGKVLPRVQRKLAMERAKPYQHPYSIHKEVSRPQPLSTITKRSSNEKVISRAGFINNVLTKIEEVWLGKETTPQSSPATNSRESRCLSPSARQSYSAIPEPFLGTPITMTSKRKSRLMDLVVHPSCRTPGPALSPLRPPSSWMTPKSISKAPELSLLQTPQVVKRARALAASGPVFSAFTPQSILRSSLRPTPVATPSASPGRSITPPLRGKESRITFIQEEDSPVPEKEIRWTNGVAADSEISLLTRGTLLSKATGKSWATPHLEEVGDEEKEQPRVKFQNPEGGVPSPPPRCSESESSSVHDAETRPSLSTQPRVSLSFETSHTSVRSTDTTLEFYDAPLSQDQESNDAQPATERGDEVVTLNVKAPIGDEEPEEKLSPSAEQPVATSEEDEEVREQQTFEDVLETCPAPEAPKEEDVLNEKEAEQDVESIGKQEDAATLDQEEILSQGIFNLTESTDPGAEDDSQDQAMMDPEPDVQWKVSESLEFTELLKQPEATEETSQPEEDLEQSTDLTEFVQQHLFGSDLSPPLARTGIHDASHVTEMSVSRESVGEVEEAPPVLTSQESSSSVTSSERTGTDSHSVVSLDESEDLSVPESEEDDGAEEWAFDQPKEDSGSEVEIIEEVQGNGRLPPLQPSQVFFQQGHTHFLPSLSEQEVAEFSLIPPDAVMKVEEDNIEAEVVMVRLGASEGEMHAEVVDEQGSSYMELKPSTTLLVPLELMEGQQCLIDSSQLDYPEIEQTAVPDVPDVETHCGFSLMLEMDEGGAKEADALPLENDLPCPTLSLVPPAGDAGEEDLETKPGIFLLDPEPQYTPLVADVSDSDRGEEILTLAGDDMDGLMQSAHEEQQADQQAEKIQETGDAYMHKESELVILAQVHDPAALSAPDPVGELPAVLENDDAVAMEEVEDLETIIAEKKIDPIPAENPEEPVENGPLREEAEIEASAEPAPVAEEQSVGGGASAEAVVHEGEEVTREVETKKRARGRPRKHVEEKSVNIQPDVLPVPGTPSSQRKKAPYTPTRMTTRARRTVTFVSPLLEDAHDAKGPELAEGSTPAAPASPGRTPRKSQVRASTPRRGGRKATPDEEEEEEEEEAEGDAAATSKPSSPARRRVTQKASTTRVSQKTQGGKDDDSAPTDEKKEEEEAAPAKAGRRASAKPSTPAKGRVAKANTPRRSSRKNPSGNEVDSAPLDFLEEDKEAEDVFPPRGSKKMKFDEEVNTERPPSPGRATRQSSRITLNVYPESATKTRTDEMADNVDAIETEHNSASSRRRKLWDHPEEDLLLLDSPLEVDSETPVADALIKRLQDEEEKQDGEVVVSKTMRTSKRGTKSSAGEAESGPPTDASLLPEPANAESSPDEQYIVYSPSRRRTRARRAESPGLSEEPSTPATRSRRKGKDVAPQDAVAPEGEDVDMETAASVSKTRKSVKQTAKSKSVSEPSPMAEVDLLSPLPSPADTQPRTQKRTKGEAPASGMNLRRKRIMDTVFTKPVTRRKKL